MKLLAILACATLSLASPARAALFELKGTMTCNFTEGGKLVKDGLSMRELVAAAIDADTELAKHFALVYDPIVAELRVVDRCEGVEVALFAVLAANHSSSGPPKNGKFDYALIQMLSVTDWDGSTEMGTVTCNLSGAADENTGDILNAKGACGGALTIFDGDAGTCTLNAKLGGPLKLSQSHCVN